MVRGTIIIAESSAIVRSGILKIIQDTGNFETVEIEDLNHLNRRLRKGFPDLLIIRSKLFENLDRSTKSEIQNSNLRIITIVDENNTSDSHDSISIFSSKTAISNLIEEKIMLDDDKVSSKTDQNEISSREITIIREIALGRTSKEIADKLYISAHTVLTHRKNINKKLDIKTASGLTVYAILNNIVKLEELEKIGI